MLLHDPFEYFARTRPDSEFAIQNGRSLSYGEAGRVVDRMARRLAAEGFVPSTRIGLLAKNSIEYVLFYFAASKAGLVPVPLNFRLAPAEWNFILEDSDSAALFVSPEFLPATQNLPAARNVIPLDAAALSTWAEGAQAALPYVSPNDIVVQMYTSGTTGRPKGAMLSHANVASQITQVHAAFETPPGRCLTVAPLYHIASFVIALATIAKGGSLHIQDNFIPAEAVRALSEDNIAWGLLVPAMIQACLVAVSDVASRRYPSLKVIAYGASPIAESTLTRAMEVFRCGFAQGYGMTETTACISVLTPSDHARAVNGSPHLLLSAGRAVAGTELRIVDLDDNPLPPGELGEIVARGPQVMRGYWKRDDATADAIRDGWMHTGDAGRMDAAGYLYIEDRVKDMIVSGGENIYPREVEHAVFSHPAVADCAVIGVPDDKWGEAVKAFVVLRSGAQATSAEIIAHCRQSLAGYKIPASIEFLEALPRNPSGKVLKRELREPYWRGRGRRVSGS